jgi:hypothetical protein
MASIITPWNKYIHRLFIKDEWNLVRYVLMCYYTHEGSHDLNRLSQLHGLRRI